MQKSDLFAVTPSRANRVDGERPRLLGRSPSFTESIFY